MRCLLNKKNPGLILVSGCIAYVFHSCIPRQRDVEKSSAVGDLVVSSFVLVSDAGAISVAQARRDSTLQLRSTSSTLSLRGAGSRPTEADPHHKPMTTQSKKGHFTNSMYSFASRHI